MHKVVLLRLALIALGANDLFGQLPQWQWAVPMGYTYPVPPVLDDEDNYYFQVLFQDSVAVCGQNFFANGSGRYVAAYNWANGCLWAQEVDQSLGDLYLDANDQLRFKGWFHEPLQLADSLFDSGAETLIIDGAIDPINGPHQGVVVGRAVLPDPGTFRSTALHGRNGRIHYAVNFADSIQLGDTLLHSATPITVYSEFDTTGSIVRFETIGEGVMELSGIGEDDVGRLFIAGGCEGCQVLDTLLTPLLSQWPLTFLACMDTLGNAQWIWREEMSVSPSVSLLVADRNRIAIGTTYSNNNSSDASSYVALVDSAGMLISSFPIATNTAVQTPQLTIDTDRNLIAWGYYIGSGPDQRVICADSSGTVLWTLTLDQSGNLWGLAIRPVAPGTYMVAGSYEFDLVLGQHYLPWESGGFTNGFVARLSDTGLAFEAHTAYDRSLYPNPTSGLLRFSTRPIGQVSLFDPSGRLIMHRASVPAASLDLSSLAPGLYFLTWNGQTQRVIKE